MAFTRPTLAEIVDRTQQDFVSRLDLAGAVLRQSMVYILARVVAGAVHMLYGHQVYLGRQLFPDQSDELFLLRQGALYGIDRNPAEYATGNVVVTGTDGEIIPEGTLLIRADGAEFETTADGTIASGTVTIPVTAVLAGADGNCVEDVALNFESPQDDVDVETLVDEDEISGGTDEEEIEDYRVRVIERMRSSPQGGASADYVAWAKEVPGVTRAWAYPQELGAGTVVVRFVRDDDASPIPDSGEVEAVQDYIDERRPVTAAVTAAAPTSVARNYTIAVEPDTAAVRAAVQAELEDMHRRLSEPGVTLLLSQVRTAIGIAEGLEDYTLSSPTADTTYTTGQIATMGTITWVP